MSRDDELDHLHDLSEEEATLFADLAERLRVAHRRVAAVSPESERQTQTRRLLAISDAAKHDLHQASRRLDTFLAELSARAEDGPPHT